MTPRTRTQPTATAAEHLDPDGLKARRPRRRFRRFALAVVALMVVGMTAQAILDWRDARSNPAPGELIELADGRRLHVQLSGVENEGPLVILEAGAGSFSTQWSLVQQQVSEFAPVLSYDRAGLGWSDGPVGDRGPEAVTADLVAVLDELDAKGPFLLVGHSFGAVFSRMFAEKFPNDVAGLVLVDPAHEEQFVRFPAMGDTTGPNVMRILSRVGLFRLLRPFDSIGQDLDPTALAQWKSIAYSTRYADAQAEEAGYVVDVVSPWFAARDVDLGDTPLVILQAADAEWPDPGMQDLQREIEDLSTRSRFDVVKDADHFSIVTDEGNTRLVATAIAELINTEKENS